MASIDSITPIPDPCLPEIIITEPSPLNPSQPTISMPDIPSASMAAAVVKAVEDFSPSVSVNAVEDFSPSVPANAVEEFSPSVPVNAVEDVSPSVSVKVSEQVEGNSSDEEYSALPECTECIEPFPQPIAESRVDVTEEERSSPEIELNDLRPTPRCCPGYGGFRGFCYKCSELIDSKYSIPLWIILMAFPISFGFMGARYLKECKSSPATPVLLFMIGITCMIMLTARIMLILHKATCEEQIGRQCIRTTILITFITTLLMFLTELMSFWRYHPSFDITSQDYCDPIFYNFTYWINWAALTVFLLILVLRIPKCLLQSPY